MDFHCNNTFDDIIAKPVYVINGTLLFPHNVDFRSDMILTIEFKEIKGCSKYCICYVIDSGEDRTGIFRGPACTRFYMASKYSNFVLVNFQELDVCSLF